MPKNTTKITTETTPAVIQTTPKPSTGLGFKIFTIISLVIIFCLSGTALGFSLFNFLQEETPVTFNYGDGDGNSASFVEGSIAEVANRLAPAVVSILVEGRSSSVSAGTGMIITSDGYILTNKHVVDGARSITIITDNNDTYENVKLVGTDPTNDVAILKVNAKDLPTVILGDSKTIIIGQQVIAIGNALGQYQNTITSGIISGLGRSLTAYSSDYSMSEELSDMIQTDAAINAGNSGGPLVNAAGEVIGINTAVSSEGSNLGFAIPISSVKGLIKSVIKEGRITRSYAGVRYFNITPDIAIEYDLPVTSGAYLFTDSSESAVIEGSPAADAGLETGDIITKVNGISIGRSGSFSSLLGEYAPGDTVQLEILRDGETKTLKLTLGTYEE
jgi:serine protease Do